MASSHGELRHLLPESYKRLIASWLEEDCPSFDYGGFVVGESEGEARLLGKSKVRFDDDEWVELIYSILWAFISRTSSLHYTCIDNIQEIQLASALSHTI